MQIGSTATVDVEPLGPYFDGGYTVVDIPNPRGQEFRVNCEGERFECEVVLATPSGELQSANHGADDGTSGTYKAVIIATAGTVDVSVSSRS